MEYLPYKIDEGSRRIEIFLNKFHGLLTFSSLEEGKEYLKKKVVKRVKWEESGKNAQDCVYTAEQIAKDIYSVKEGLFVEEMEDGFALKRKETGYFSSIYVNEISYYMLASFSRPTKTHNITVQKQGTNVEKQKFSQVVAELRTKLDNHGNNMLKNTGLREKLLKDEEVEKEPTGELYITSHSFEEIDDINSPESDYLPLPELLPLPIVSQPVQIRNMEPIQNIIDKANKFGTDSESDEEEMSGRQNALYELESDLQEIEKEYQKIEEEEKIVDRKIKEVREEILMLQEKMLTSEDSSDSCYSENSQYDTTENSEYRSESSDDEDSDSDFDFDEDSDSDFDFDEEDTMMSTTSTDESYISSESEDMTDSDESFWDSSLSTDSNMHYGIYSL